MYESRRWGLVTPPHPIRLVVWLKDVTSSYSSPVRRSSLDDNQQNSRPINRLVLVTQLAHVSPSMHELLSNALVI